MARNAPIGVFDSRIGGLTVARAITDLLPNESIIYFGDTAHLPYGDKSSDAIRYYVAKISDFLYQNDCKVLVIACNTASSVLERSSLPPFNKKLIINVIDPIVDWVAQHKEIRTIGVIGTKRTIGSGIYMRRLRSRIANIEVKNLSTPLLAPMIDEGFFNNNISKAIIASYLDKLPDIDALILACTHYPLIRNEIAAYYKDKIQLIDAPELVALKLSEQLHLMDLNNDASGPEHRFIVSDFTESFEQTARIFFGESVHLTENNIWK